MNVHFFSQTDDWSTPQAFFDKVSERFGGFWLDAAASKDNAKCDIFFSEDDDALEKQWASSASKIWLNPPYGRIIGQFMAKAVEAYKDGCLVVCLVPARTDTAWWHDYVMPYAKVEFIRGRLKFGNAKNSAPFPSALVIYDGRKKFSTLPIVCSEAPGCHCDVCVKARREFIEVITPTGYFINTANKQKG